MKYLLIQRYLLLFIDNFLCVQGWKLKIPMQRIPFSWWGNIRRSHYRPTQQLLQYKRSPTMMWFKRLKSRGRKRALINTRLGNRRSSLTERIPPCLGPSPCTVWLNTDPIKTPLRSWPESTSACPALTRSSVLWGRVKTSVYPRGEKQHSIPPQQTPWTSWETSRSARRSRCPPPATSWWWPPGGRAPPSWEICSTTTRASTTTSSPSTTTQGIRIHPRARLSL